MNILVWQWGRRGGGPRYAAELADGLRRQPGLNVTLSLSAQAEILRIANPPTCAWPVPTYAGFAGFLARVASAPARLPGIIRRLRQIAPEVAICAMPGPLDLLMALALRRVGCKLLVVVHDATPHPGDGLPRQALLQRALLRRADGCIVLSNHVAAGLRAQGVAANRLLVSQHPPRLDHQPPPPLAHGGPFRLLCFGRLLPYKGLDLLAAALAGLGPRADLHVRIVGQGPETPTLAALRAMPNVTLENRWVPEDECDSLLLWADGVVLPYREASQSGIAAAAISAGRHVVATDVGGLREQLAGTPAALCPPTAAGLEAALRDLLATRRFTPPPHPDTATAWHAAMAALATDLRRR